MRTTTTHKAHSDVKIGHIHLHVSDLDRALHFYRDILGFEITSRLPGAVFISAGGYHHHIGLNTWQGKNAKPAPAGHTGLYHYAILYPNRKELALALKNLIDNDYPLEGFADHGVSEAVYLKDPDGNGIELYWDRPKKDWPKNSKGELEIYTKELDVGDLLKEVK